MTSHSVPTGSPISTAILLNAGKFETRLRGVLEVIDSVHGDGKLPACPVEIGNTGQSEAEFIVTVRGQLKGVVLSRNASTPEISFCHEVGHLLDHQAISPGQYASDSDYAPTLRGFREAVQKSEAYRSLQALAKRKTVYVVNHIGRRERRDILNRYVHYLLQWHECWARAYAQYIAVRSGDVTLIEQLHASRASRPYQVYYARYWSDANFEPIADAIDSIFQDLGWQE